MATAAAATPAVSTKHPLQDAALRAWRSKRLFAFVLLAVAVVIGAYLRFHRLTLADMNGDEGFSWAKAIVPSVRQVIRRGELDPGKLAFYYILLHGWIEVFGDSLFAMRSLSAGLGTIAIVLVFATVREICLCLADEPNEDVAEMAGGFTALIFATNLRMVLASRLARMYPLMLVCALVQILFFVRAQRKRGFFNYLGVAVFTALMIAANFSAAFLLFAEGLWLAALLLAKLTGVRTGRLTVFRPGFAVLGGLALLAPILLAGAGFSAAKAVEGGVYNWIKVRPITWPFTVLRDSTGDRRLFWILIVLGALGIWRQWRAAKLASGFLAAWMLGPILAVLAVTYLMHSLEFHRYVLIAFVGLFAVAGLGAASVPTNVARIALAVLLVSLAIHPTHRAIKHPYEASWHQAVALAVQHTVPGERIAVFPQFCDNVARFYAGSSRRGDVVGVGNCRKPAAVLLLTGNGITSATKIMRLEKCYPHLIKQFFLIQVRS